MLLGRRLPLGLLLRLELLQQLGGHLAVVLLALGLRLALSGLHAVLLGLLAVVPHRTLGQLLAASEDRPTFGGSLGEECREADEGGAVGVHVGILGSNANGDARPLHLVEKPVGTLAAELVGSAGLAGEVLAPHAVEIDPTLRSLGIELAETHVLEGDAGDAVRPVQERGVDVDPTVLFVVVCHGNLSIRWRTGWS